MSIEINLLFRRRQRLYGDCWPASGGGSLITQMEGA